eukprot:8862995-Pyramimonas_sp.AAC.1
MSARPGRASRIALWLLSLAASRRPFREDATSWSASLCAARRAPASNLKLANVDAKALELGTRSVDSPLAAADVEAGVSRSA